MASASPILSVTEPFKIFVGDNSVNELYAGFLEAGKTTVKGGTSMERLEWQGGDVSFPNYWEAWGRRVVNVKAKNPKGEDVMVTKDVNSKGEPLTVTDLEYKGEIEFLDQNSDKGYIIYCRYITGQSSLDYDYQTMRLNLVTKEKDEKNLMFNLERGEMKINPVKDRAFALAIKVHPMNADSRYKTSRYQSTIYKEVNVYESNKSNVKALDLDFEAKRVVKASSSSYARLKVLHTVLSDGQEIKYDSSDENALYDALMLYANEQPAEVLRLFAKYKEGVSGVISMIQAHNDFDFKKDGTIALGNTSKKIWMTDVKGKNEDEMVQSIFSNALEPEYYDKINELFNYKAQNYK